MAEYIDVKLQAHGRQYSAKIEKGCSFENNGSIYRADENGSLSIFDKKNRTWSTTDSVRMTNYQLNTFKAVANNVKERGNQMILSKADVSEAMSQYKRGIFRKDISQYLSGYKVGKAQLFSKNNTISAYVTNNKGSEANMLFGFGTKENAVKMSDVANKKKPAPVRQAVQPEQPSRPQVQPPKPTQTPALPKQPSDPQQKADDLKETTGRQGHWISNENIQYREPKEFTATAELNAGYKIANEYGVSLYRLKVANPDIDLEHPLKAGTKIIIPGRYSIKPGSVHTFEDVVKTTGLSENYIQDILVGLEGRHGKPDLKAYYDGVSDSTHPRGYLTIGFGHTGRVNGKPLTANTEITEAQAYELLAQDILDAKIDAMVYMGKSNFTRAPKSIQTAIVDIVFNKGVEPFYNRPGSPTQNIKSDLERGDYISAAADTILGNTCKGLRKRNVYRAIMATGDLSPKERKKALKKIKKEYKRVSKEFRGLDKTLIDRAWKNAHNGITSGFFK